MNPAPLYTHDGEVVAHYCTACRRVVPKGYEEACCRCTVCDEPLGEGQAGIGRSHAECQRQRWADRVAKRLAEAEVVVYEGGFVYSEGHGYRDGYFESLDDFCEWLADENEPEGWPDYVFACKPTKHTLDLDDVLERLCESGYEDMGDHVLVPKSLTVAVAEFNRINESRLVSWGTDYKRKIRVPVEELRAAHATPEGGA